MYPLDDSSVEGMTEEEINERIVNRTNELNKHLDYIMINQNYDTVDSVNVASSVVSQMLTNMDGGKLARKAIDTEAHSKIVNLTEVRRKVLFGIVLYCLSLYFYFIYLFSVLLLYLLLFFYFIACYCILFLLYSRKKEIYELIKWFSQVRTASRSLHNRFV